MIIPTVGRVVWYTPADANFAGRKGDVYPAIVTHVFTETCVNLHVLGDGSFGVPEEGPMVTSVCHSDNGDPGTWRWMPYQISKAKDEQLAK